MGFSYVLVNAEVPRRRRLPISPLLGSFSVLTLIVFAQDNLDPAFADEDIKTLDVNTKSLRALDGSAYLQGKYSDPQ